MEYEILRNTRIPHQLWVWATIIPDGCPDSFKASHILLPNSVVSDNGFRGLYVTKMDF
jgi:hypothetical protein